MWPQVAIINGKPMATNWRFQGDSEFYGDVVFPGGGQITTTANGTLRLNPHNTGFTIIGSTGAGGFAYCADGDDLAVSGVLQALGSTHLGSTAIAYGSNLDIGNSSTIVVTGLGQTLLTLRESRGRQFVVGDHESRYRDFDHATPTNPSMYWHSKEDPDNSNPEYFSWRHNGADALYSVGLGGYIWGVDAQPARGTLTFTANPTAGNVVVGVTPTTLTAGVDFDIGADLAETMENIVTAINACADGTTGDTAGKVHAYEGAGDTIIIEYRTKGVAGNAITFTKTLDNCTIDGANFLGGTHAGVDADDNLLKVEEDGKLKHQDNESYGGGVTRDVATLQTTDATVTKITGVALADNEAWSLEATVVAMESDGSNRNLYHIQGLFFRNGGAAAQQGATANIIAAIESAGAWDADFAVNGNDVEVRVTGAVGDTVNWKVDVKYMKVNAS